VSDIPYTYTHLIHLRALLMRNLDSYIWLEIRCMVHLHVLHGWDFIRLSKISPQLSYSEYLSCTGSLGVLNFLLSFVWNLLVCKLTHEFTKCWWYFLVTLVLFIYLQPYPVQTIWAKLMRKRIQKEAHDQPWTVAKEKSNQPKNIRARYH
jgi:hypothetical protein